MRLEVLSYIIFFYGEKSISGKLKQVEQSDLRAGLCARTVYFHSTPPYGWIYYITFSEKVIKTPLIKNQNDSGCKIGGQILKPYSAH